MIYNVLWVLSFIYLIFNIFIDFNCFNIQGIWESPRVTKQIIAVDQKPFKTITIDGNYVTAAMRHESVINLKLNTYREVIRYQNP